MERQKYNKKINSRDILSEFKLIILIFNKINFLIKVNMKYF